MKNLRFLIVLFIVFVTVLSAYFFLKGTQNKTVVVPTPRPIIQNLEKDYSFLNKAVPGRSTSEDVVGINGSPNSTSKTEGKTIFFYQTPSNNYKNMVVFKNNTEIFAVENVFGNYRGDYKSFQTAYGDPDLVLYSNGPFVWSIFLRQGVGIEGNNKDISKILYFVPQRKEEFLSSVAKDLGLLQESNHEVLRP